ncbi:MAG: hypothetical protein IJE49_09875 [Agathobacter sp.]|nr:hypothetical protein [Agathobacter sp.]
MYNIWGFLLQTVAVSIVALIILVLKRIFEDKLSPRWQYSIWALLAIRIIVPVNLASYVIPQLAYYIELTKAQTEEILQSNYSAVYEPIRVHHVIPVITEVPFSITDWLFILYTVGIIIFMLKYLVAYIQLRILLKKEASVSNVMEQKMLLVCDKYDLKPCKIVAVKGLTSAFICGVFRPILAVPKDVDLDEKVLLHELLHLKYNDTIQNIGWCILRSLHWCNPLIHFIVNRIENDMEALCDQRVLELLEGEDRREYGNILLSMANQKYARIPGTTSISNGGNNISKRIASIVRFKKYPQGMALVSICIILTLFWPTIIGSAVTYDKNDYLYYNDTYRSSMTIARINRCSTVAGAIDMYAKGVYLMNGGYVASASSFSEHERIENEVNEYGCYQPGKYVCDINYLNGYYVYNLDQISKNEYTAIVAYHAIVSCDEYTPQYNDYVPNVEYGDYSAYILLPVSITFEDGWCIKETDERKLVAEEEYIRRESSILCGKEYYGKNDIGEIRMEVETRYSVDNTVYDQNLAWFTDITSFDLSPKPNAVFDYYNLNKYVTYTHLQDEKPNSYIELYVKEMNSDDYFDTNEQNFTSSDHTEEGWHVYSSTSDWTGSISDYSGGGFGSNTTAVHIIDMPSKYQCSLNIDGVDMEDIILEEVAEACKEKNN